MTDPFAPADGVRGRGKTCADYVRASETGAQIPDHEIMELLECGRSAAYAAMREARKILEERRENSIETRIGFGWVVIDRGTAQLEETKKQRDKAGRALSVTARRALAVDDDLLDQIERQEKHQIVQSVSRAAEIKNRPTRSLAALKRLAQQGKREIPDQRVRQLPTRRQEGA